MSDWNRDYCPACKAVNWFCMGNVDDITSVIGEEPASKCWKCGHVWWRVDEFERQVVFEHHGWADVYPTIEAWFASPDITAQLGEEIPR